MVKIITLITFVFSSLLLSACSDKESSQVITASEAQIVKAISGSDDYEKYKSNFIKATMQLVQSKKCSITELKKMGGWTKSQSYKKEPIYFTYCGGMSKNNKVHINAQTCQIYK